MRHRTRLAGAEPWIRADVEGQTTMSAPKSVIDTCCMCHGVRTHYSYADQTPIQKPIPSFSHQYSVSQTTNILVFTRSLRREYVELGARPASTTAVLPIANSWRKPNFSLAILKQAWVLVRLSLEAHGILIQWTLQCLRTKPRPRLRCMHLCDTRELLGERPTSHRSVS